MDMPLYNAQGAEAGTVGASDTLFKTPGNADLVYQVATSQMANRRKKLAHAKGRAEVRGGGRKPWRQKGTGRARHGSIRSPIWKGGGVTHGPTKDVVFKKDINKMVARRALAAVLSARLAEKRLIAVDSLETLADGKTKSAVAFLAGVAANLPGYIARKDKHSRILVVLPGTDADTGARRALSNISYAGTMRAADLNALDVLSYPYVVMTKDAVVVAEKTFAKKK